MSTDKQIFEKCFYKQVSPEVVAEELNLETEYVKRVYLGEMDILLWRIAEQRPHLDHTHIVSLVPR